MPSFRQPTRGRMAAAAALIALFAVTLPAWQAAADHDGQPAGTGSYAGVTPLAAMPPLMARAYAAGIQEELLLHGYDGGPPDGVIGQRSVRAIRAYQRDAGLPADGLASKELLDHLKFALPKVYAGRAWQAPTTRPQARPNYTPEYTPQYQSDAPTDLLQPAPETPSRGFLPDDVIREPLPGQSYNRPAAPQPDAGPSTGGVISQIQSELARLGYYNGPIDGLYGAETRRAVTRYQQDVGLPASGEIDQALLDALLPAEQGVGSLRL